MEYIKRHRNYSQWHRIDSISEVQSVQSIDLLIASDLLAIMCYGRCNREYLYLWDNRRLRRRRRQRWLLSLWLTGFLGYGLWGMVGGKLISGQVGSGVIKSTCGRQLYQPANGKRAAIDQLRNAATASLYIGIHMVSIWYVYGIYMALLGFRFGFVSFR